jgi:phenylacetate-CoA ligase
MHRIWRSFTNPIYKRASNQVSQTSQALVILLHYRIFKKTYNLLKRSQWWSREQLRSYQLEQLRELLNHAYQNVPYYTKIFEKHDIKPRDIHDLNDLQRIPFLTKEIVRKNINDLKARNYPQHKFKYITTGGTTGIPLGLYEEKGVSDAKELAFYNILLDRCSCSFKDKFIVLRGAVISSSHKGKFWKSSLFGRCLNLSSYHLNDENLPKYVEKIRAFKPKFITAYPSSITIIARFMKKNSIEPFSSIKAIICGAENLYDWQRYLLKKTFKCKIFAGYGHYEQAVFAGTCEKSDFYHISPEYGIVEIIGKNGKSVTNENESGEIVATGFNNHIFPFIRYRTGDVGVYTSQKCSCGRNYPLIKKIEGRLQEFIITNSNRPISISSLNMHSNIFDNIKQFQFYQEKKSHVVLKIVRLDSYTEKDTIKIKNELGKKLGDDIDLIIRFVDEIPRTLEGKYQFLVQKIPIGLSDLK